MISFDRVERFVVGTIGAPGEREFYLQVENDGRVFSFAIEKGQAAALADRMKDLLKEVRNREGARWSSAGPDDGPLKLPVDSEFIVSQMSLMWDATSESVLFEASGEDGNGVALQLSLGQAAEFIRRTERVVSAGRAPCPFCGLPLNLEGHLCPRANGYRR